MLEIEDMKDELATIVVSETATGLRRWDTPDVKTAGSKPGRMRKDRYSALLMANMAARQMARALPAPQFHETIGGFAGRVRGRGKPDAERLFHGPAWYTDAVDAHGGGYGAVVRRGGV
jgi:hypothetical protein